MGADISTILVTGQDINMANFRAWLDAPFINGPVAVNAKDLQGVPSVIDGATIAQAAPLYISHNLSSADSIALDTAGLFPPGIGFRRCGGTLASPTDIVAGEQLGYHDFRGYSRDAFVLTASIDAIVDSNIPWSSGDIPPSKIRFATAGDNDGPAVRVEVMPEGRLEIGAIVGDDYYGPDALAADSKFYVNTVLNDWAALVSAKPASGNAFALKLHTLAETVNDWLIGGVSGAGAGTVKFSVRANGVVDAATEYRINGTKVIGAQGAAVADLTSTATSGSLPTPNGSITIANAATPTVVELLEYCVELEAKLEALLARVRAHGLIA